MIYFGGCRSARTSKSGVSLNEYVERKKATEDERSGNLESHYGYPRPFTQSPSDVERSEMHATLREHWDGDLPSVLDPTAGGGVIPYESLRYGLPTHANELNPVPSVILKVMLEYAPAIGDIEATVKRWANKVDERAAPRIQEYFPSSGEDRVPDNYVCTCHIQCHSCGTEIPLVPKWWIQTRSDGIRVVVRPEVLSDGSIEYEVIVDPDGDGLTGFDPNSGPVSRGGDAECLNCGVVTEDDRVRERLTNGEFEYQIYCVRYLKSDGHHGFRSPNKADRDALETVRERVNADFALSTFLSTPVPEGNKTAELHSYEINKWQDMFSPRQLVANCEYVKEINHFQDKIKSTHDSQTPEAVIVLLTLLISKLVDRNSRLTSWDTSKGYPSQMFKSQNYAFKRIFVSTNISAGGVDFLSYLEKSTVHIKNCLLIFQKALTQQT